MGVNMKNKKLIKIFNITLREIILFLLIMVINGLICIDSDIGLNTSAKRWREKVNGGDVKNENESASWILLLDSPFRLKTWIFLTRGLHQHIC